jgi:hypothetical protein
MPQETANRLFILASSQSVTTAPWFLKAAAGRIDPAHLFHRHIGAAIHDDRWAGKLLLNGLNHLEDVSSASLNGVDTESKDPQLELRTATPRRPQSLHPEKNQKSFQ